MQNTFKLCFSRILAPIFDKIAAYIKMSNGIILFRDIEPIEKPKLQEEFLKRLEICNLLGCLRSNLPLEEKLVDIRGFEVRLCHRKNDKIWVIQEPNCKFYRSFIDHNAYRDNREEGFGFCDNMKDPRHREAYGCPLAKKYGTYLRINHPDETYMFVKTIVE